MADTRGGFCGAGFEQSLSILIDFVAIGVANKDPKRVRKIFDISKCRKGFLKT
jgi:hypothetical protein